MFKILFVFFCIVSNMFSETFGIDVPVEGIWRIDTAKKGESIEVANMVGFNVALKFEKDGSVRKLNYQTLAPLPLSPGNSHIWELKNKGIIHITVKNPNGNFITDYMLNDHYNTYFQIFQKTDSNCYKTALQNGNKLHQHGVIMCKVTH